MPDAVDFYGVGAVQVSELDALAKRIAATHPSLDLDVESTVLDPRDALLREAVTSDLLIVGSTEQGAARRLLFGSVARTAARRSPCPLVVVRGTRASFPIRRIAVGIDGSSASETAVRSCRARSDVDVLGQMFDGSASTALSAATLEVDLVAIGSRGHGGFRTTLFGSVALAVVEHSLCPVAIAHPQPRT